MTVSTTDTGTGPGAWGPALRSALFAFLLSRTVVLLAALLGAAIATTPPDEAHALRLLEPAAQAQLTGRVLANDAGWYLTIMKNGYSARPFDTTRQENWAFFPAHPLLWNAVVATGLPYWLAGVLLANTLFFAALLLLHRWVASLRGEAVAGQAVLGLALYPTAYFFSLPWTESLFLVLLCAALLAAGSRRWWLAGGAGALLSATRATGVLFAPLMWWMAWRAGVGFWRRSAAAALVGVGLALFMGWLWWRTGNPLAFADIQVTWGRDGGNMLKELRHWLTDPLQVAVPWNLRWVNNGALLFGLAACVWLARNGHRPLALFAFGCLLLPWSTGTLMSMGRYVLTCAPLFLALGVWLQRPRFALVWLVLSACGLAFMSALFVAGAKYAGA